MEERRITKKALQQRISSKSRVGKCRKSWKDGVREDAVTLLGIQTWETKAIDTESWRQHTEKAKDRFGLFNTIAVTAAARRGYTLLFTVGARLLKLMEIT